MTIKTAEAIQTESTGSECVHHWLIEGDLSATCKLCGAEKQFPNFNILSLAELGHMARLAKREIVEVKKSLKYEKSNN